ncbi:MAG: histidine ammonia-lyase [Bdellovibrio sp.]|nr:histidine ammonia-lyase [Bdellovibrio sp.]
MSANQFLLDQRLDIRDIWNISRTDTEISVVLSQAAKNRIIKSRDYVEKIVTSDRIVYGINTGFGALSSKKIDRRDLEQLQSNLIRSHCTGVGNPFSERISRAILLVRTFCLAQGFSGICSNAVDLLIDFLNHKIHPVIPEKGSVGASGDLAPLAHMALALIGEGDVVFNNKTINSSYAIHHINRTPLKLGAKDGLALINGTSVMSAIGALCIYEAALLAKMADIVAMLTLEGVKGSIKAFHPLITGLKPHPGQVAVVQNLNKILPDSEIMRSHHDCNKVQDPYSLRCIPQVHGAARQTLQHAWDVISTEINSVTDNPLIFSNEDLILSGGNFHGQSIALAMDYLAMGLSELGSISERRIEKMMNPSFSDLPAFLTKNAGLNSGLMIAHVTSAALASENKGLCHPASIDSIPTSTDKEDHVSMGVTSARKLQEVISNVKHILAIETLCAYQALQFQHPLKSSAALENVILLLSKHIAPIDSDRPFFRDINKIVSLFEEQEIIAAAERITGVLN